MKDNRAVLVKVCGLTDTVEADYLNKNKVDFAGFVLFFQRAKKYKYRKSGTDNGRT